MKKILGIIVVVVVLLAIAAPYAVGYRAEQLFRHQVQTVSEWLGERYAKDISIEIAEYDRGYMMSTVTTRLTIDGSTVALQHDVTHGPYLVFGWARVESRVDLPARVQQRLAGFFKGPALVARTTIGFFGAITVNLHSSAFRHPIERRGIRVAWQGMNATLHSAGENFRFSLKIPNFAFERDNLQLAATNVEFSFKSPGPGLESQSQMSIRRFSVSGPDGSQISGQTALRGNQDVGDSGEMLHSRATWTFKNLRYVPGEISMIEPFRIAELKIAVAAEGLDADAVNQFIDALRQEIRRGRPDERSERFSQVLMAYAPKMLTPQSAYVFNIPTFVTEAGQANAQLEIRWAGKKPVEFTAAKLMQQVALNLKAMADVSLVKTLMARAMPERVVDARLSALRASDLVTKQDGRYRLTFSYEDGAYTLNGEPAKGLGKKLTRRAMNN